MRLVHASQCLRFNQKAPKNKRAFNLLDCNRTNFKKHVKYGSTINIQRCKLPAPGKLTVLTIERSQPLFSEESKERFYKGSRAKAHSSPNRKHVFLLRKVSLRI